MGIVWTELVVTCSTLLDSIIFFGNFFCPLPSTFCECGQFLVVGSSTCPPPPALKLAYVLNAGIVHKGTPFFNFSIFGPLHAYFGILFTKLESKTLI
jgi:hypothetical protein